MNVYESFQTWPDVLAHVAANGALFYHAPLDRMPVAVCVRKVYKNGNLRLRATWRDGVPFTADSGHLTRFRRLLETDK